MELHQRFSELLLNYTEDETLTASLWKDIQVHYSEKHRAYHNLQHLREIFSYYDMYRDKLERPTIIAFSIFYHDIIYNIWSKDNEEESADYAIQKLTGILSAIDLKEIHQQIIATKTHDAENNDTKWLVDFDLAILAQSNEVYNNYVKLIRKEYKSVPNFIYKKGRKKVLQHFIKKTFIFATNEFRSLYEQKSKENLNNELKNL